MHRTPLRVLDFQDPQLSPQTSHVPDHRHNMRYRLHELGLQPQRTGTHHLDRRRNRPLPSHQDVKPIPGSENRLIHSEPHTCVK